MSKKQNPINAIINAINLLSQEDYNFGTEEENEKIKNAAKSIFDLIDAALPGLMEEYFNADLAILPEDRNGEYRYVKPDGEVTSFGKATGYTLINSTNFPKSMSANLPRLEKLTVKLIEEYAKRAMTILAAIDLEPRTNKLGQTYHTNHFETVMKDIAEKGSKCNNNDLIKYKNFTSKQFIERFYEKNS